MCSKERFFFKRLFFVSFILIFSGLLLQAKEAQKNEIFAFKTDLASDARVSWGVLENGLRYALMENEEPPGKVSMRLYVGAGSLMEQESQRGLAHFLEHMAFNGTKQFPKGGLVEYFQRIGMAFGAHTNAHTSFDETVYKLELPNGEEKTMRDGLRVLRDFADGMLLNEGEIEKERGVILSEKRDSESANRRITEAFFEFAFPGTLIPERLPIGIESVIKEAKQDRFKAFYQKWYRPDLMAVVIVGNIDKAKAEALLAEYFASLKKVEKGESASVDVGNLMSRKLSAKVHKEKEAATTEVSLSFVNFANEEIDNKATRAREIHLQLAAYALNKRLARLLEKEETPFSSGRFYTSRFINKFNFSSIDLTCKPENWKETLGVAEQEIRKALEYGFTKAQLKEAKAILLNQFEENALRAKSRYSASLASSLVSAFGNDEVFTSPDYDLAFVREVLAKTTLDNLEEAFKQRWKNGNLQIFISGPEALEASREEALSVYKKNQQKTIEPLVEPEADLKFAYQGLGTPGKVAESEYVEDLDLHKIRFENNLRLNFKKTQFKANEVLVGLSIGGGISEIDLAGKEGLSNLAAAIFVPGGLEAHSAEELNSIFAGSTVQVNFGLNEDCFYLGGGTSSKDLGKQLDLMLAYLLHPGYREEAVRIAKEAFEELYNKLNTTPEGVLSNEVEKFLVSEDNRFGYPPKEKLFERTSDEVKEALNKPLKEGYLELTIVGDVSKEKVIEEVARTLGALPLKPSNKDYLPEIKTIHFPQGISEKTFTVHSKFERSMSSVYWPTADKKDVSQARKLSLLGEIFTDRLRKEIREKFGEAYSTFAYNQSSFVFEGYGRFQAQAMVKGEKVEDVSNMILQIGLNIAKNGIEKDEFERAKKPLLESIDLLLRQNTYWLGNLMGAHVYPEKLMWLRTQRDMYEKFTIEEIEAVARKFLKEQTAVRVHIIPALSDKKEVEENSINKTNEILH